MRLKTLVPALLLWLAVLVPAAGASDFDAILAQARGTTVNLYMWGGAANTNAYIDDFVAPNLLREYGVTLRRFPIDDPKTVLRRVEMEKNANQSGAADVLWLNGENFKLAKDLGLLWGPFVSDLPNVQLYVDESKVYINEDFAEPVEGLEAPWGRAQFVIIYDSARMDSAEVPRTFEELQAWAAAHPGRFTYPMLPDFTGSALVRTLWTQYAGENAGNRDFISFSSAPFWQQLKDLRPQMYQNGFMPPSIALLDTLFGNGEVDFSFSYNPAQALNQIAAGIYPATARTTVFRNASIANTHFLGIPITSTNTAGAMATINYLLSPQAQLEKQKPEVWGDDLVLEPDRLSPEDQAALAAIRANPALPDAQSLADNAVGEIPANLIELLEELWQEHVLR